MSKKRIETVIIGGGQAGLAMGYELKRRGEPFVILDAFERVGDAWRKRWDSLRLFTPRRFNGLDGLRFPGTSHGAPTKDEMADYLEAYARRFELPVRTATRVERLARNGHGYLVETTDGEQLEAGRVVIATGANHHPKTPAFAEQLDPAINQLHSDSYKNRSQLRDGPVLIVGSGNSGADIAIDIAASHPVVLAGRHPGHVPFRIESFKARFLVRIVRFVGQHVLTWRTPVGRKVIPKMAPHGRPLVRVKPKDLAAAGVERVGRIAGVRDGRPVLEDGRVLDVANVIWCTGFELRYDWSELPLLNDDGTVRHRRGISLDHDGIFFLGLDFQFSATSDTLTGLKRDARYVAKRMRNGEARGAVQPATQPAARS